MEQKLVAALLVTFEDKTRKLFFKPETDPETLNTALHAKYPNARFEEYGIFPGIESEEGELMLIIPSERLL